MEYRPADVLIHAFQQERDLAIDVNITGTRGSNDVPIEQLQKAVDRKHTFYLARCDAINIDFTTFVVVDLIGGIHPDAAELITRIAEFCIDTLLASCGPWEYRRSWEYK
jgi:hypothetical protein